MQVEAVPIAGLVDILLQHGPYDEFTAYLSKTLKVKLRLVWALGTLPISLRLVELKTKLTEFRSIGVDAGLSLTFFGKCIASIMRTGSDQR